MAEVYWDLEWTLSSRDSITPTTNGCTTGCAKAMPGRCATTCAPSLDYQNKMARFLENHDEPRAAATFSPGMHEAAAVITFLVSRAAFFPSRSVRRETETHIATSGPSARRPTDETLRQFYDASPGVLRRPVVRDGQWQLLECEPAWEGNWTSDCFLAFAWQGRHPERLLIAVNYAGNQSQCRIPLPFSDLTGRTVRFQDLMSAACYEHHGDGLQSHGLYLDMPAWGYHVFESGRWPSQCEGEYVFSE